MTMSRKDAAIHLAAGMLAGGVHYTAFDLADYAVRNADMIFKMVAETEPKAVEKPMVTEAEIKAAIDRRLSQGAPSHMVRFVSEGVIDLLRKKSVIE